MGSSYSFDGLFNAIWIRSSRLLGVIQCLLHCNSSSFLHEDYISIRRRRRVYLSLHHRGQPTDLLLECASKLKGCESDKAMQLHSFSQTKFCHAMWLKACVTLRDQRCMDIRSKLSNYSCRGLDRDLLMYKQLQLHFPVLLPPCRRLGCTEGLTS